MMSGLDDDRCDQVRAKGTVDASRGRRTSRRLVISMKTGMVKLIDLSPLAALASIGATVISSNGTATWVLGYVALRRPLDVSSGDALCARGISPWVRSVNRREGMRSSFRLVARRGRALRADHGA